MVKLFKKSGQKQTATFKFNSSLQLKNLELEEYAHVIHAFHKGLTELDHFLKESLLENYISFHTIERISRELELVKFCHCKIPNVSSLKTLFYSKAVELKTSEPEIISKIKQIEVKEHPQEVKKGPPPLELAPKPIVTLSSPPQAPSTPPTASPTPPPPISSGSPTRPKIVFSDTVTEASLTSSSLGTPRPQRESDRATGIAILRKQMVEELKKIRTILPE
ncbi:MAG: hypothetical protein ACFFCW_43950 [Candidatus Hodarchaeota archaeon]